MDAISVRELFDYDAANGGLIWKIGKFAGLPAGYKNKAGYISVHIRKPKNKMFYVHRLVWLWHHGVWPSREIDHDNGIYWDNHIENLKDATPTRNQRNKSLPRNNTSGAVGVRKTENGKKWTAMIMKRSLGVFDTFEEALTARKEAEKINGFGLHHGRERTLR